MLDTRGDGTVVCDDTPAVCGDTPVVCGEIPGLCEDAPDIPAVLNGLLNVAPLPLPASLLSPLPVTSSLASPLDGNGAGGSYHGEAAMTISGDAGLRYLKPSTEPWAAEYLPLKIVLNKKWNDFLSFSFPASFFTFTSTSPTSCTWIVSNAFCGFILVDDCRSVLHANTTVGRLSERYPRTRSATGPNDVSSVES